MPQPTNDQTANLDAIRTDFREAAIDSFKAAWHAADERGKVGARTEAGIDAVLAFLAERLGGDEVREEVARAVTEALGLIWPDEAEAMHGEAADAALAAVRECLGVQR